MIKVYNDTINIMDSKTDFIVFHVDCDCILNSYFAHDLNEINSGLFRHCRSKYEHCQKYDIPIYGDNDYYWSNSMKNNKKSQCIIAMFDQVKDDNTHKYYTDYGHLITCLRQFKADWPSWVNDLDKDKNEILRRTSVSFLINDGACRGLKDWENIVYIIEKELIDYDVEIYGSQQNEK